MEEKKESKAFAKKEMKKNGDTPVWAEHAAHIKALSEALAAKGYAAPRVTIDAILDCIVASGTLDRVAPDMVVRVLSPAEAALLDRAVKQQKKGGELTA